MAFVRYLLSWIPLVSFESDQGKQLSFDHIEQFEIDIPSVPDPPQAVAKQIEMADRLESSGWNVDPPNHGETHSHFQKVWRHQFFVTLKKINPPVYSADAVKKHVSKLIDENNSWCSWHVRLLLKVLSLFCFAWVISILGVWYVEALESSLYGEIIVGGFIMGLVLVLISTLYANYAIPNRMSLKGVHPVSYTEDVPDGVRRKIDTVRESAPNVNITPHKVVGTSKRFATASCDGFGEYCFADWSKSEGG
jgi:hypothetical protein